MTALHYLVTYTAALRSRLSDDRGQTAAEYMGLIVVIGLVLGAIVFTDIGSDLTGWIRNAIASVFSNAGGGG